MKPRYAQFLGGAFGISLLALAATAGAQQPRYCEVAFTVAINGKPVAAPSLVVEYGTPADVTIEKPDRTGSWQFHVTVDPPTMIRRATTIPVDIAITELTAGESYLRAEPQIGTVPGQRATIETIFGNDDGRKATIQLVATPRSDAEVEAIKQAASAGNDAAGDEQS
jgi:hypothetical protein